MAGVQPEASAEQQTTQDEQTYIQALADEQAQMLQ